ncbi:uncharacterized protein LOC133926825 [Phragmites australis]|uniref:uncharacterized protein LOC133926825 n=1 Tax=Phragmites australis TaxID=29695 RepID=UPI002D769ACF|nr:uncharacterized protein LOC133926825 [Phragmites australis]
MEVEPPPAAVAAALLKCRGDGGGGKVSRSSTREATAGQPQEPDSADAGTTPGTARRRVEEEEEPLRRGLAAARARARRKAGHATPSPSWKLEASPPRPEEETPAEAEAGRRGAPAVLASARQLGATLWEIQDVIRVAGAGRRIRRRGRRAPAGDEAGAGADADRPRSSGGCGAHLAASLMEHDELHKERCHSRQPLSPASYTSSVGAGTINLVSPTRSLDFNARSRQASYDLKTSTELLKVLNRIWSLEEQHAADVSVMKGLKRELQHAQACIQELMQERQRYHHEIDSLSRQVTEDKMARRNKEQEKIRAAFRSLQEELEDERRLRKHSETLHRKLGKEISEMKSAFCKAVKTLEKEKKATCLLEDLCDEFAKGIRNYEEEVRVLKQKHVKEYEHKFDKSVVHISEAWLDERMQMQKADVREDLPAKTSITERLSSEIESFLHRTKRSGSSKNDKLDIGNEKRNASLCRQSLESVHLNGATSAPQLAEDDDSSVASDLHCFELNMHGGAIKNHDLAGTQRRVTGCMHSQMRRLEYSNGVSVEGSPMSNAPPCSKNEKARSSIGRQQFIASTPEISSHNDASIAPIDAIKNHDLAGTRRRVTGCMHSPMRRLEYSNGVSVEGSPMSNAPPCSKKEKARSSIGRQQFIASTPEISSHNDAGIAPTDEQNETVMAQVSRRLHDDLLKIKIEAPQHAYLGQKSNHPRTNQLREYTISRDICDVGSPARQLNNQGKLLDREISESPAHQLLGTKENTLKAKLLQARLEGQHARMSASVYPLISTRKK